MTARFRGRRAAGLFAAATATAWAWCAKAQTIEPRAYSPAPVGVNFLILGSAETSGGLAFDSSVPLKDARLKVSGPVIAYARALDLWRHAAKVDVIVPAGRLSGAADYQGEPVQRQVTGLGDPLVRLSAGLYGAPALRAADFRAYRQDLVIGASLQVSVPLGQYDNAHLVNLGAHRWWFKPEVGVSKVIGRWTLELAGSATVYTANTDFLGRGRRSQEPILSAAAHAIYNLPSGAWASLDVTYYTGGRTSLNGVGEDDLQRNWRLGITAALPVTRRASLKFNASRGVSARTGNGYDQLGLAWQYRWGDGF